VADRPIARGKGNCGTITKDPAQKRGAKLKRRPGNRNSKNLKHGYSLSDGNRLPEEEENKRKENEIFPTQGELRSKREHRERIETKEDFFAAREAKFWH